jgi:hypothetical protein
LSPLLRSDEAKKVLARMDAGLNAYEGLAQQFMGLVKEGKLDQVAALTPRVNRDHQRT